MSNLKFAAGWLRIRIETMWGSVEDGAIVFNSRVYVGGQHIYLQYIVGICVNLSVMGSVEGCGYESYSTKIK